MKERFLLAAARTAEIENEETVKEPYRAYFQKTAAFISETIAAYEFVLSGKIHQASLQELQKRNLSLYRDILPEFYEDSYANPACAVRLFGPDYGRILTFLTAELRSLIVYAHEKRRDRMVIRMELFLEIYQAFVCAGEEGKLPDYEELRQILYWFTSDYAELATEEKITAMVNPRHDFAAPIIMESNLADIRYLYFYGEYITENEIATARHLLAQPDETIGLMADTFTEGYRKGFELTGKDIGKKKTVNIRFTLGFERMIRRAILNFEALGLRPTLYRAPVSILEGKSVNRIGVCGAIPNKQYDYDHKDDQALVLDKQLITRRLEALQAAYEKNRAEAAVFGGPAVMETFGKAPEELLSKAEALHLSEKQQGLIVEYMRAAGELLERYIPGDEKSYTIIAFPTPDIGKQFSVIFNETIRLNTLDYNLYRDIQQRIIDTLDRGEYVRVKGMEDNRTDLKIRLRELGDPARQTKFENCVADVNIPVGEVFTSPCLTGTDGVLHVTRVFLNDLEFKNIMLTVKDGMITDYNCSNFAAGEDNRNYIKENVLYHHASLPMGEFAIGTNTTAYVMGEKYGIAHLLPILIAEKTGPHFAFGDTCYSHAEDVAVFNPDGKEIIARDNEISLLRKTDPAKAYFNCHTDITIPYHELGELSVVTGAGEEIAIIRAGRFVLAGCEELNKPFADET